MPIEYEPVLGTAPSFLNITARSTTTTAVVTTSAAASKSAAESVRADLCKVWWSGVTWAMSMALGAMVILA